MSPINIRGVSSQDEIRRQTLLRDTRSMFSQAWDAFGERDYALFGIGFACVVPILFPATTLPALVAALILYMKRRSVETQEHLPFRLPATANCLDHNDMLPGRTSGYAKAKGVFYVGQEHGSGKQLWLKTTDILTHMLVFGTTGSGKTEYLVSMAFNALALGSGFFYVDPKGAPKLPFQVFTMCRMLGRDDDFRVMNYNTGGKSVALNSPKRMSNTQNPFAFAAADAIQQLIVSLIPKTEGGNSIFSQNAQVVISGIIYGLVDLRDKKYLQLSTSTINDYLNLSLADTLARDARLSEKAANQVKTALRTVGWREEVSLEDQMKSNKALNEQFGYARAYFGLFLNQLGYTYGYIFNHQIGEMDMQDLIMQRRILVVILPSLEKSPQELESLGKITLSSVRNATAVGLGDKLQGTAEDVLQSLPTDSPYPFLSITDEYAAIPTPGYAEVLTQGRGLGVAAIVASQDWAGIEESDKKGAQQIAANTKFKVCMKLEDPKGTWELFKALAGQVLTMRTQGYENDAGSLSGAYYDALSSKAELEDRLHIRDLQEQTEGEFHAFFNGEIVRGSGFYANPMIESSSQLRIPQMLPVLEPEITDIEARRQMSKELAAELEALITRAHPQKRPLYDPEAEAAFARLNRAFDAATSLQPMEQTIVAFMALAAVDVAPPRPAAPPIAPRRPEVFLDDEEEMEPAPSHENAADSGHNDFSAFLDEFNDSDEQDAMSDLALVEELMGANKEAAREQAHAATQLVRNMTADYPEEPAPQSISSAELAQAMRDLFK